MEKKNKLKAQEHSFLNIKNKPIENQTLCMNCSELGLTTILNVEIKSFRNIQISHFECQHCEHFHDSIQFLGDFPSKGVHAVLHVKTKDDLERHIIKSSKCCVKIPSIGFEIPNSTQADVISTVKDILLHSILCIQNEISQNDKINTFVDKLNQCANGLIEFDFVMDDPSGNSFIESVADSIQNDDQNLIVNFYERTEDQIEMIGLNKMQNVKNISIDQNKKEKIDSVFAEDDQIMTFQTTCACCSAEGTMRFCTLIIPHFKEIVLMTFNCEQCGYHKAEFNICGSVSSKGRSITLFCNSVEDLKREILKSESASIIIPECDFEMSEGSIGGKFTTIEGLLIDICANLRENNPYTKSLSDYSDLRIYNHLISTLTKYSKNEEPFTIIINDSLSNSYIQKYSDNDKLEIVDYERSEEDNEYLGIIDMKTEEYIIQNVSIYTEPKPLQQKIDFF